MALKLLFDYLTGNLALVNVPAKSTPATPTTGNPIGLLLALTYS